MSIPNAENLKVESEPVSCPSSNSSKNRLRMKLADYMSPAAGSTPKITTSFGMNEPPNLKAVSKIKRREHARKLFGAIEQAWVPSLKRIKADAFGTLKMKTNEQIVEQPASIDYSSVQSFGVHGRRNDNEMNF